MRAALCVAVLGLAGRDGAAVQPGACWGTGSYCHKQAAAAHCGVKCTWEALRGSSARMLQAREEGKEAGW